MIFISLAAVICVVLPFYNFSQSMFGAEVAKEVVPFYDLLSFKPYFYFSEMNDVLNTIREISGYLTIAVLSAGGAGFLFNILRLIMYKNKFLGVICGIINILLVLSTIGLGVISLTHCYLWENGLKEIGLFNEGMKLVSLGGIIYTSLGGIVPSVIIVTNFIKK
jgi:hypothetical protein